MLSKIWQSMLVLCEMACLDCMEAKHSTLRLLEGFAWSLTSGLRNQSHPCAKAEEAAILGSNFFQILGDPPLFFSFLPFIMVYQKPPIFNFHFRPLKSQDRFCPELVEVHARWSERPI